jgi:hypothetical protein
MGKLDSSLSVVQDLPLAQLSASARDNKDNQFCS